MFTHPLPWYVAGPLIGLVVPALLLLGNKQFGVSGNFRHLCAALVPREVFAWTSLFTLKGPWSVVRVTASRTKDKG